MGNRIVQMFLMIGAALCISLLVYWQVHIIRIGGPVMAPIVMCSIFSVAVIIERAIYFGRLHLTVNVERWFEQLRTAAELTQVHIATLSGR